MRRSTAVWRPVRLTVNGMWPPQIFSMKLEAKAFRFFPVHYTKSAIYIYVLYIYVLYIYMYYIYIYVLYIYVLYIYMYYIYMYRLSSI